MVKSLYKIDEEVGDSNLACAIRRKHIEEKLSINLEYLGKNALDFSELVGKNIENPIGAVQVPVGLAGPMPIDGEFAKGEFYVPLATTEGALVAGVNRGCSLIKKSGSKIVVRVIKDKMTRAPVLKLQSLQDALIFVDFTSRNIEVLRVIAKVKRDELFYRIKDLSNLGDIKEIVSRSENDISKHNELISVKPEVVGNTVFVEFSFSTGDAMGMNMATIASNYICMWLMQNSPVKASLSGVSGNFCVDKKPNSKSLREGRGKTVVAEVYIERKYVEEIMNTSPRALMELNMRKNMIGSALSGSLGYNAHFANIIAATFLATGQDIAHISEASVGLTSIEELENGDLYASVYTPDLPIGSVGGGTRLPTTQECLKILGCEGSGDPQGANAKKLAEIISSAVLAGELNLLSAIAANELAKAHQSLGR